MTGKNLGVKLTKWLIAQRPGLLHLDAAACGEVAGVLADTPPTQ